MVHKFAGVSSARLLVIHKSFKTCFAVQEIDCAYDLLLNLWLGQNSVVQKEHAEYLHPYLDSS